MTARPDFGPIDLADFSLGAMLRTGIAVRRIVRGATSVEAGAGDIVRYLYDNCLDPLNGSRSCALVRFYKTHSYGALGAELQSFARAQLGAMAPSDDMRCLTLLATAGDEVSWNDRHASRSHQAIPLPSAEIVRAAPMIARLIEELGLDIDTVIRGAAPAVRGTDARTYDVFHVERAVGSPYIPAQKEFVVPYRIASVVGFGGLLRSGELFAIIIFSHVPVPIKSAARFRTIALDVRSALYNVDEQSTWKR